MPEEQLDLFQLATRRPAQFGGCTAAIVRRDPGHYFGCAGFQPR